MEKTAQQSLIDILIQIMPSLQEVKARFVKKDDGVNRQLYSMWLGDDKIVNRKFLKPANIETSTISKMVLAGLVEEQGKYLKITEKGAQAIKVMVLEDDFFALEKKASSRRAGWYKRLKNEDIIS